MKSRPRASSGMSWLWLGLALLRLPLCGVQRCCACSAGFRRARWAFLAATAFLFLSIAHTVDAHPLDKASLLVWETEPGSFDVRFQSGSPALREELKVPVIFPKRCVVEPWQTVKGAARTHLKCGVGGLSGSLRFPWLHGTLTRLMVDIQWHDGSRLLRVASASASSLTVYAPTGSGLAALSPVLIDYIELGVEHIVFGFDHLLFVVALTYLVRRRRMLFATITAFTAAHSLTLAATALGVLKVSAEPVEAMIALSIVLLCAECLAPGPGSLSSESNAARHARSSLTRRAPWLVAFAFGLLHGLGFASALLEVGLPERHLPSALLSFNLGVELGQLGVVALVLALQAFARRPAGASPWIPRAVIYTMGSVAAFWSIERVLAVLAS